MRWFVLVLVIAGAIGTVVSLATGRTLNPVRGFSGPLIISKKADPMAYWAGVYTLAFVALAFGFLLFTHNIR
jgi:hypothetical protein